MTGPAPLDPSAPEPESLPKGVAGFPVDLHRDGVIWALNATLFHPRGFALAVDYDDDWQPCGFFLYGDGTEPWRYASTADIAAVDGDPAQVVDVDTLFLRFESLLAAASLTNRPRPPEDTEPDA